ncbi:glycoside hydrolase family 97 protein [Saccharobesus litoralis]|nr:glycoside hydrolase family 97 protein [Saccharobesus litoralis]
MAWLLIGCQLLPNYQKTQKLQYADISFELFISEMNELKYKLNLATGEPLVSPSNLAITIDGQPLRVKEILKVEQKQIQDNFTIAGNYAQVNSQRLQVRYQLGLVDMHGKAFNSPSLFLDVSLSERGVAFRYVGAPSDASIWPVHNEQTEFNLSANSKIWYANDYEADWQYQQLSQIKLSQTMTYPVVAKTQGHYVLLTQAKHHNYHAVHLVKRNHSTLVTQFVGKKEPISVIINDEKASPWRVIMVSKTLNQLVNNSLVYELADPEKPQFKNANWIKPGRSGWSWITGGFKGQNFANMREHINHVAKLGWEYLIIDDGWEHWQDKWQKITTLCELGKQVGVGIILWKPTGDYSAHWQQKKFGPLPTISGILDFEQRDKLFKQARKAGVAGFKVDFVNEDTLQRVNIYKAILDHAADYQFVINFHGSNLPTGLDRTYPNELTREAVRGMEFVWKQEKLFQLNTILPFTRYVVGHGDYTPVLGRAHPIAGSRAHQLATSIVFNSPMNAFAVHPKQLLAQPEAQLLKSLPTTWDETRVLEGSEIGKSVVMAKRKGKIWYLAVLSGEHVTSINIKLSDILIADQIQALIYQDGTTKNTLQKQQKILNSHDVIQFNVAVAGGYVAKLTPIE